MILEIAKTLFGTKTARKKYLSAAKESQIIADSLKQLPQADESEGPMAQPIFILSAGWRSGSTLLQRLVMSDPQVLIWGEVYDHCNLIQSLARSLTPISESWPPSSYLELPSEKQQLSNQWTANMYPALSELRASHRAMIDRLLCAPAQSLGQQRWGMKEVRFGEMEARYIRWLYPKAKLLFIHRNPFDAYISYKSFSGSRDWFASWPDEPVFTAAAFGRHWSRLARDFVTTASELDAFVVRYEDLVGGRLNIDELEAYCDVQIDRDILQVKVGGPSAGAVRSLTWLEEKILQAKVNGVAIPLGYGVQA